MEAAIKSIGKPFIQTQPESPPHAPGRPGSTPALMLSALSDSDSDCSVSTSRGLNELVCVKYLLWGSQEVLEKPGYYQKPLLFPNPQAQASENRSGGNVSKPRGFSVVCEGRSRPLGSELWGWSQPCSPPGPGLCVLPQASPWCPQWGRDPSSGHKPSVGIPHTRRPAPQRPWTELDPLDFPLVFSSQNTSVWSTGARCPEGERESKSMERTCAKTLMRLRPPGDRSPRGLCVRSQQLREFVYFSFIPALFRFCSS